MGHWVASEFFRVDEEIPTCENEIANPIPTLSLWPTSAMKSNEIEHLHATGWVKVAALSNIKVISDSSSCSSSTHHHAEYPLNCD